MKTGIVRGSVWATKKAAGLMGQILLQVETDTGTLVAADLVGAGTGDHVLVTMGSAARTEDAHLPVDAAIVGILDLQEEQHVSQ